MIGPVKGRVIAATAAAGTLILGGGTAWAAFVTEGSPYAVGTDPYNLNAGDFNGDGRPDIATVNGTSSDVSVFLRQVRGGFAQEAGSPIRVGPGPSGAAVGDYNGDGRPDLAVSSFNAPGTVSVLLRQAGGGFALENGQAITVNGNVTAIAAGDFNSDGRLDFAVTRSDNNQVTIYLRNGTNNGFSPQLSFPTGSSPRTIAVGDYNGDGAADLAIANRGDGTATILLQAGGTFTAEPGAQIGADAVGIATADFNGDGRADLAVPNYAGATVTVLLRRASNDGFTAEPPDPVSTGPASVAAADFDRDGRPDLAVASNAGGVDILHRAAGGGFTRDPFITLAGTVNGVTVADFDGDSRPDVAVSAYGTNTFTVLVNPAPAGPPPGPTPTPTPLPTPVAGKTVNVAPVSGKVTIKRPGSNRFLTLTAGAQIPVGSSIDTRTGRISITAAQGKGKTATADFFDGLFKLTQTKGSKPVTTLALTEKLICPRGASAAAKKKKSRKLWGDGSGSFRTRGQYSAATVRGTRWLTQDSCTSTLTRVVRGAVSVRDLVKRKTVIVRAGKRYTARAKRR
jgi:hypothetical protein